MLFTNAFTKDKRGSRLFNIVHLVILDYDTVIKRLGTDKHIIFNWPIQIVYGYFLMPILAGLHYLEQNDGMLVQKFGET